ncbi:MAG: glycine--tRNA ligase [Candidatus Nanoarchaeia archaeon]|jgi:glycyl-tRNA synthetase
MKKDYDKITSLFKRKGFIWGPSPEIYEGGLAGFYDLGPYGTMLWHNIANTIRESYFEEGYYEVSAPIIMPRKVWEASGHVGGFTDPLIKCTKCGAYYRADKLISELYPKELVDGLTYEEYDTKIDQLGIKCLKCKSQLSKAEPINMMLKTTIGINTEAFLRPETATTTYLQFKRYYDFFRSTLPFGVFQIGKAFRNEISPRQGLLRGREFNQAEAQLFILKSDKNKYAKFNDYAELELPLMSYKDNKPVKMTLKEAIKKKIIMNKAYATSIGIAYKTIIGLGLKEDKIRLRQHHPNERAFYALDAWDVEYETDCFSWIELGGVHDRGDYDLKQHSKYSGQDLTIKVDGKKETPHVLEIALGVERLLYVSLEQAYEEEKERKVLRLPAVIAPIEAKVLPLMKKDGLDNKARAVHKLLLEEGLFAEYDETGSIGKRYRRADEEGVPFCITIDHDTLEKDTVTLRDRDSMKQLIVKIDELEELLDKAIEGRIDF